MPGHVRATRDDEITFALTSTRVPTPLHRRPDNEFGHPDLPSLAGNAICGLAPRVLPGQRQPVPIGQAPTATGS